MHILYHVYQIYLNHPGLRLLASPVPSSKAPFVWMLLTSEERAATAGFKRLQFANWKIPMFDRSIMVNQLYGPFSI